ncbi:MAG: hypothetical protein OXC83_03190 [Chloroflexi bacterium]|nr:hypothetical protein [Chloroflexota bacterium]
MIAIDSIIKLNTSVVFVTRNAEVGLGVPGLLLGANPLGLNQIIEDPDAQQSADGLVLSSMRNQFVATISANRLQFDDRSEERPARQDFPDRVTRAAEFIGRSSNQAYSAVVIIFEIEASPAINVLPSETMLNLFVKPDVLAGTRYNAMGAAARLWYSADDRTYEFRLEPRGNQYNGRDYFAHLNIGVMLPGTVPSPAWLSRVLYEEYEEFKSFLSEIPKISERSKPW